MYYYLLYINITIFNKCSFQKHFFWKGAEEGGEAGGGGQADFAPWPFLLFQQQQVVPTPFVLVQ